jgi:osmoprotectant transport system permease protein
VSAALLVPGFLGSFGGALDFIFSERESVQGGLMVGGLGQIWELLVTQMAISVAALLLAITIALPLGLWLGHRGVGEFAAVAIGNAGRAIPELALIALMVAFIGTGNLNVTIAVTILGIPPILTNAFVGVRQADRGAVDASSCRSRFRRSWAASGPRRSTSSPPRRSAPSPASRPSAT